MTTLTVSCTIIKGGSHNLYGEEIIGVRKKEKCAVVELTRNAMHTSLRTDKTASIGAAEELLGAATLLLSPHTSAEIGDTIVMDTRERFKVASIQVRYTVRGTIDHLEIRCGIGR